MNYGPYYHYIVTNATKNQNRDIMDKIQKLRDLKIENRTRMELFCQGVNKLKQSTQKIEEDIKELKKSIDEIKNNRGLV